MNHWLMMQKFTALNTMYRKTPGKQTTYRSFKGNEKQIDYILIKKKEKGDITTSRKGIANVFGEFYTKKPYDDDKYDETELEHEENETENSIDDQGYERLKKKANQQTAMESELKTSKLAL